MRCGGKEGRRCGDKGRCVPKEIGRASQRVGGVRFEMEGNARLLDCLEEAKIRCGERPPHAQPGEVATPEASDADTSAGGAGGGEDGQVCVR